MELSGGSGSKGGGGGEPSPKKRSPSLLKEIRLCGKE